MKNIKIKYDSLSKSKKIAYLAIAVIISIGLIYNAGEIFGKEIYNFTH